MTAAKALHGLSIEEYLAEHERKELVRFVVVGSVDDGKSTLIGRLLYETDSLYEDQIAQVKKASRQNGGELDFSYFTDGLKAEREQAITIDVAYRYFSTARRKFIIADTPGHVQYTRNMATGASTADVALLLMDARHGLQPQTRRHAYIASLLGIPQVAVVVNKMDLVGWESGAYERIREQMILFAERLGFEGLSFLPVSAWQGDNIVTRSERTPWYPGGTLLEYLESVPVGRAGEPRPLRFPVQYVLRPHLDYRAFAGQVASGTVQVGEEVVVLPSGRRTRVSGIDTYEGPLESARAAQSVAVRLADETDVSRGDMLVRPGEEPRVTRRLEAMLVWLSEQPLDPARDYLVKHTTRLVPARVERVHWRQDLEALAPVPSERLELNDIGRVTVRCPRPLVVDAYKQNRATGSFILIDALTNGTVAAGMVLEPGEEAEGQEAQESSRITAERRRQRLGHGAAVVWAESRALAYALEAALYEQGCVATVVEGSLEAAQACAQAGLVCVLLATGSEEERARQRAALRVGEWPWVEASGEGPREVNEVVESLIARGVLSG